MARLHPKEVFSTNKTFVNAVFNNLTNPESETLHSLSVQTLGFIGSSVEGKLALEKLGTFTCLTLIQLYNDQNQNKKWEYKKLRLIIS